MPISIAHSTRVISVPQSYLTNLGGGVYELDVNQFRLDLKDLEDDADGMTLLDTHRHNTQVTVGGVTLARTFEIINGFTITFENLQYAVKLTGANSNIPDVMNVNQVSLRSANTAGLIVSGSGVTAQDKTDITSGVWANGQRSLTDKAGFALSTAGNQAVIDTMGERELDGRLINDLFKDLLALATGRIVESPAGVYTYYARDNVTPRFTLQKTGNQRVRL